MPAWYKREKKRKKEKPNNRKAGGLNKLMAATKQVVGLRQLTAAGVQVFDPAVVGHNPFDGLVHLNISLKILQGLGLV